MAAGTDPVSKDLFPRFSQAEFDRRHRMVRQAMAREDLEAILVYGGPGAPEVSYLINYLPASPCWLVFPRQGAATVFLHFYNHIPCTKAQAIIDDVRCYGPSPMETLAKHLRERNLANRRISLVSLNTIAYNHYMDLQRRLPEVEFAEFGRQYHTMRWVRSEEELVYLQRSGYLTDLTCEALEIDPTIPPFALYQRHGKLLRETPWLRMACLKCPGFKAVIGRAGCVLLR